MAIITLRFDRTYMDIYARFFNLAKMIRLLHPPIVVNISLLRLTHFGKTTCQLTNPLYIEYNHSLIRLELLEFVAHNNLANISLLR